MSVQKTKLRPILSNIVVKMDPAEKFYGSGLLHVPDAHQKQLRYGTVLAVGSGVECRVWKTDSKVEFAKRFDKEGEEALRPRYFQRKPEVRVGDRVLCAAYGGVPVPDEQDVLLFEEREIYASVEP